MASAGSARASRGLPGVPLGSRVHGADLAVARRTQIRSRNRSHPFAFLLHPRRSQHRRTPEYGSPKRLPGAAFFRRVAFASLVVLACLGSYLVMREGDTSIERGTDAAAHNAQHDVTADHAASSDRIRQPQFSSIQINKQPAAMSTITLPRPAERAAILSFCSCFCVA